MRSMRSYSGPRQSDPDTTGQHIGLLSMHAIGRMQKHTHVPARGAGWALHLVKVVDTGLASHEATTEVER